MQSVNVLTGLETCGMLELKYFVLQVNCSDCVMYEYTNRRPVKCWYWSILINFSDYIQCKCTYRRPVECWNWSQCVHHHVRWTWRYRSETAVQIWQGGEILEGAGKKNIDYTMYIVGQLRLWMLYQNKVKKIPIPLSVNVIKMIIYKFIWCRWMFLNWRQSL